MVKKILLDRKINHFSITLEDDKNYCNILAHNENGTFYELLKNVDYKQACEVFVKLHYELIELKKGE